MPAASTVAMVGLAVGAVGTVGQLMQGQEARKNARAQAEEMRRQAELEQRKADVVAARNLRQSVRQARIARASIINQGATSGTNESSGVLGGVSSVASQEASNIGFVNRVGSLNSQITASQARQGEHSAAIGDAQGTSAIFGAFGNLGGTVFQGAGGFRTIFSQ